MFGSSKNTEETHTATASSAVAFNALVKGTIVEGNLTCESDLRVDGIVKGKIACKSKIIIGPTGQVEGDIVCANAVIEGRFRGNLKVGELLNVRETAEVEGEVVTNKLVVQSGARFNVTCKMDIGAGNGAAAKVAAGDVVGKAVGAGAKA
ncbi:MAG: polymer-forming cytoskeletal protein [Saprospiraceae bacterium]|nr:polymer-forming cytoskeletal protein [Saprospiraceae bacterium]MDW8484333.1 polymer-forming cytoskeletal protein [Saprospiraceae bacterium]